jgi:putative toxin-antitoxin system antitoxin component (TIGR02293 family)
MKQRKASRNIGKAKRPPRQQRQSLHGGVREILMGGLRKRSKPPKSAMLPYVVIRSGFDTATGLTALSDRAYGPNADVRIEFDEATAVYFTVAGPLVQMDPSSLKGLHGFTDEEIYSLVVPKRTLARRTAEKQPLSVEETDRAVRLARVGKMAETVFGSAEKAHRWLRKPKPSLEGATPLNYLASETGARVVEEMLTRIDHGILP